MKSALVEKKVKLGSHVFKSEAAELEVIDTNGNVAVELYLRRANGESGCWLGRKGVAALIAVLQELHEALDDYA